MDLFVVCCLLVVGVWESRDRRGLGGMREGGGKGAGVRDWDDEGFGCGWGWYWGWGWEVGGAFLLFFPLLIFF